MTSPTFYLGSTQVVATYLGSTAVSLTIGSGTGNSAPKPSGSVPGTWTLAFQDEFDGTSLDTTRWGAPTYTMNNVTPLVSNISFASSVMTMQLSDASHGAFISSAPIDGAGANGYVLQVGHYAEARVWFPGNGSTLYNWPAWWASKSDTWPADGEIDAAEVLGGVGGDLLTTNYHYGPTGATSSQAGPFLISGYWGDAWHTFGMYRKAGTVDIYWDGTLVKTIATSDNGGGQGLMLNIGAGGSGSPTTLTGAAGALKVDYVRAWAPA